jgi:hypothetical protein
MHKPSKIRCESSIADWTHSHADSEETQRDEVLTKFLWRRLVGAINIAASQGRDVDESAAGTSGS